MKNRAGTLVSNLSGDAEYKSFLPNPLPPEVIELDNEAEKLLIEANKKIAFLEGISSRIPNIELFVSMYVRKEALVSSQIEGTQCTLDDVLDPNINENTNLDVSDVINYIKAYEYSVERLKELPLCNRLFKEIHSVLLQGVRGAEKAPGEFRTSQNWIGGAGSTIKNAKYIPPNPEDMLKAMSDLEKYINSEDELDSLIRAALIHYQFETIHPFLDGNGRVGRLLIILFLIQEKLLSSPVLYISCFLKMNRVEYYDRMTEVRNKGNYEQWIKFFLSVIAQAADDAIETIDRITQLHNRSTEMFKELSAVAEPKVLKLFGYIEKNPIIDTQKTANVLGFSYNTTAKYIDYLCEKGILKQTAKAGKANVYSYEDYLNILRKDT